MINKNTTIYIFIVICIVLGAIHCSTQRQVVHKPIINGFPVILQTTQLTGHLIDSETSHPIPNAHLLINGTNLSSRTDSIGTFQFKNIPIGLHDLMVDIDGYYPTVFRIDVPAKFHSPFLLEISLNSLALQDTCHNEKTRIKMLQLQMADLRKKLSLCSEEITLFKNNLIGNQPLCQIVNPDVIDYDRNEYEDGYLIRYKMRHPLIIENKYLGYRMTAFFKKAVFKDLHGVYSLDYYTSINFVEIRTTDEKQFKLWQRNRRYVYEGSFRHFLTALANRQVDQEGFVAYRPPKSSTLGINALGVASQDPTWSYIHDPYQFIKILDHETFELDFEGMIRVTYIYKNLGSRSNRMWGLSGQGQSSIIQLVDGPIQFNKYGHQTNLTNPHFSEYWKTTQISELLPLNYKP